MLLSLLHTHPHTHYTHARERLLFSVRVRVPWTNGQKSGSDHSGGAAIDCGRRVGASATQRWAEGRRQVRTMGPHLRSDGPTDKATDRRSDRASAAQRWAKVGRDLAHSCAHVGRAVRSYAHQAHRPTDAPTGAALRATGPKLGLCCAHVGHFCPIAAHSGRHLPQLCARTQRPTDAHRADTAAQRWAKGARQSAHSCAHVGHASPSATHQAQRDQPTDRRTDRRTVRPQLCAALRQISAFAAQRRTDRHTDRHTDSGATAWRPSAAIVHLRPPVISQSDVPFRSTHTMYQLASIHRAARPCGIGTSGDRNRRRPRGEPSQS